MTPAPTETIPRSLTMNELAIQAATTAKLNSFATAYEKNPGQASRVEASFAKTCSAVTKFAQICDSGLVKQLFFVQPNFKMAIISCPFATQNSLGDDVIAGSLGDALDIICPVTIRMKDARGEVISVCSSRVNAEKYKLAISTSNPLDEEGPELPADAVEMPEPAGPDRIRVDITDPTKQPCIVAIPKVFPFTPGYSIPTNPPVSVTNTASLTNIDPDSLLQTWYETIRYGCLNLDNHSIHARDTLFVYENLEKNELIANNRNLASRCTVGLEFPTYDDPLYTEVIEVLRSEKDKANLAFGTQLLANQPLFRASTQTPNIQPQPSQARSERERAREAAEVAQFYSILFASTIDIVQDDGTTATSILPATIHPLFTPVLIANKNSKATKALKDAVEAQAAELSQSNDKFASAANLNPRMFDQPLTAALRAGQWEHKHTVLNPTGITSNFGLYHLAPPRTNSAIYRNRQEGETLLVQQEQVEEDKSRVGAKITDLYFNGRMGNLAELNEMIGNFYALMNVIIEFDARRPPILWQEIVKFDKILRTEEGRSWCDIHRYAREILFNVVQEIQSTIAGFVNEARKQGYKKLVSTGTGISSMIFADALLQSNHILNNFTSTVLSMGAGTYKESTLLFKVFNPEPEKRKRDNAETGNTSHYPANQASNRQRTAGGDRSTHRTNTVTPSGSPSSSAPTTATGPPGKVVFMHEGSPPPMRLPHPGAIFPHATRPSNLTLMCCRSAYSGRDCVTPTCTFYHFPNQLSSIPRELKDKLKAWVTSTPLVQWHGDAVNWATPVAPASYHQAARQNQSRYYYGNTEPSHVSVTSPMPTGHDPRNLSVAGSTATNVNTNMLCHPTPQNVSIVEQPPSDEAYNMPTSSAYLRSIAAAPSVTDTNSPTNKRLCDDNWTKGTYPHNG
ncbi:hypothetical protein MHU86_10435 [Fragilaria crotonensis]|nr:hypothetical protein MHU86_10435 [Fragilaria crotonensis]